LKKIKGKRDETYVPDRGDRNPVRLPNAFFVTNQDEKERGRYRTVGKMGTLFRAKGAR